MANKEDLKEGSEQPRQILTSRVFLKSFGLVGSSKGYAPTSITYKVTPQDQTSAIYIELRISTEISFQNSLKQSLIQMRGKERLV